MSESVPAGRRWLMAAVAGGLSLVVLGGLFVPIEVRNSEPFGRSSTFDRPRAIAVRGGYVTPNYDNFQRVDLDLRAYTAAKSYDLTVHVRPAGVEGGDVRTRTLSLDAAAIWHRKEAFADPYLTVRFPPIEESAGRRFYVWVEAGPRNRDDIWTLWSIKTFSEVRVVEVLAALVDTPPAPIRTGGRVVLILLIAGTAGSAVWLTAALAASGGAGGKRRAPGGVADSVAAAKG